MKTWWLFIVLEVISSCYGIYYDKNETNKIYFKEIPHVNTTAKIDESMKKTDDKFSSKLISKQLIGNNFSVEFKEPVVVSLIENITKLERKMKNVIHLMIEDDEPENFWKIFKDKYPFFIHGSVQGCRIHGGLNNSVKKCNCEENIRSNVSALLNWARTEKKMNTATIFAGNFKIIDFFDNFDSFGKLDIGSENVNDEKKKLSHYKNVNNQSGLILPFPALLRREAWDMMNIFSRIRTSWFKNLFDSLNNDLIPKKKSRSRRSILNDPPSASKLFEKTLKDLQIFSNENGFILVAALPFTELFNITEIIQRDVSLRETLVVISGMCSHHGNSIPIFLRGPESTSILNDTKIIDELSSVIKLSLEKTYSEHCKNDTKLLSNFDIPKKRVARSDDDEEFFFV
ncbi:uncharacterized protein LOC122851870 isoform X2 [Aphidius gifuensis]|uniref:uncharacterized protein LOC122851870 isoform X2 n=1 Tax=Aphidius gifuensis TaxID=684658 RepID=UPI001CDD6F41|nr:uncharacterized protein LOC122851870 isoform X2 [Aphidius gifuensis]